MARKELNGVSGVNCSKSFFARFRDGLMEAWRVMRANLSQSDESFPAVQTLVNPNCNLVDGNEFIERCKSMYGDKYDYSKTVFSGMNEKVMIICPKHGEFSILAHTHLNGHGCPVCLSEAREALEKDGEEGFLRVSKEVHGDKYDYSGMDYVDSKTAVKIICPKHGEFWRYPLAHMMGEGCHQCSRVVNRFEKEVGEFIESLGFEIERGSRRVIEGKEIDILVPSMHFGVECNSFGWRSDLFKDRYYRLNTSREAWKNGVVLLQLFEDEWRDKRSICEALIRKQLKKCKHVCHAEDLELSMMDDLTWFFKENHLRYMGPIEGQTCYALLSKKNGMIMCGAIVSDSGELLEYCENKTCVVIDGFKKLSKFFNRGLADVRLLEHGLYSDAGFVFSKKVIGPFSYIVEGKNRIFSKIRNDQPRVWDCGLFLYRKKQ